MALTANFVLNVNFSFTNPLDLTTPKDTGQLTLPLALTNGTGDNQADKIFHDERTLSDEGTETLDFHDGSLTDAFGNALTLDKLKSLVIVNYSVEATLLVGGAAATVLPLFADDTDIIKVPVATTLQPGIIWWAAPKGIDITTNSDLKLTHDGTGTDSLTFRIIAVGVD